MDLVTLPHGLLEFYGALVLTCGVCLGLVVGRNLRRRPPATNPEPPELAQQRIQLLERDLDASRAELERLVDDRDFMRELRRPRSRLDAA